MYTFVNSGEVRALLDRVLGEIATEVRESGVAEDVAFLVLGGGYGRGEGGIFRRQDGSEYLYNDLDFFVVSRSGSAKTLRALNQFFRELHTRWSAKLGIDVDFSRAVSVRYVKKRLSVQMWREMVLGGLPIYGGSVEEFMGCFVPSRDWLEKQPVPQREVLRLFVNRLSGLWMARERLSREQLTHEDYDFIARNVNKTILAMGEGVLMSRGCYVFGTLDRLHCLEVMNLEKFVLNKELVDLYREAVEFKKFPHFEECAEPHRIRLERVTRLALGVILFLQGYLFGGNSYRLGEFLRGKLIMLRGRRELKVLKMGFPLVKSPLNVLLSVLVRWLDKDPALCSGVYQAYMRLWGMIC